MKRKEFKVGDRVSQIDPDDGTRAYGNVINVTESTITIQWDDINYSCDHGEDEFESIKIINP